VDFFAFVGFLLDGVVPKSFLSSSMACFLETPSAFSIHSTTDAAFTLQSGHAQVLASVFTVSTGRVFDREPVWNGHVPVSVLPLRERSFVPLASMRRCRLTVAVMSVSGDFIGNCYRARISEARPRDGLETFAVQ
jgi:hypothetical protein